jgi:hypothetical protein
VVTVEAIDTDLGRSSLEKSVAPLVEIPWWIYPLVLTKIAIEYMALIEIDGLPF